MVVFTRSFTLAVFTMSKTTFTHLFCEKETSLHQLWHPLNFIYHRNSSRSRRDEEVKLKQGLISLRQHGADSSPAALSPSGLALSSFMSTMQCPKCWMTSSICPACPSPPPLTPLKPRPRKTTVQSSSPACTQLAVAESLSQRQRSAHLAFACCLTACSLPAFKDAFWKLIWERGASEEAAAAEVGEGRERGEKGTEEEGGVMRAWGSEWKRKQDRIDVMCDAQLYPSIWGWQWGHLVAAQCNTTRKTQLCPFIFLHFSSYWAATAASRHGSRGSSDL